MEYRKHLLSKALLDSGATQQKGLTQAQLASLTGIQQATISRILKSYPELFLLSRNPTSARGYYCELAIALPLSVVPEGSLNARLLGEFLGLEHGELLDIVYKQGPTLERVGARIAAVADTIGRAAEIKGGMPIEALAEQLVEARSLIKGMPQLVALLIALHNKVVSNENWQTGADWLCFVPGDWSAIDKNRGI